MGAVHLALWPHEIRLPVDRSGTRLLAPSRASSRPVNLFDKTKKDSIQAVLNATVKKFLH